MAKSKPWYVASAGVLVTLALTLGGGALQQVEAARTRFQQHELENARDIASMKQLMLDLKEGQGRIEKALERR